MSNVSEIEMNLKTKLLTGILVVGVVLLKKVTITTDKTEYHLDLN